MEEKERMNLGRILDLVKVNKIHCLALHHFPSLHFFEQILLLFAILGGVAPVDHFDCLFGCSTHKASDVATEFVAKRRNELDTVAEINISY